MVNSRAPSGALFFGAKRTWHNEALQILDTLVAAAVEDVAANDPPSAPAVGTSYLIGGAPTGEWAQHPGEIASYTSAGWRFVSPTIGLAVFVKSLATVAAYGEAGWEIGNVRALKLTIDGHQVVGPRATAISDPEGGTTIDAEARSAILQILATLRQHGLIWP